MLAATGFVPLLVNLKSMTAKPKADGGSKNCVAWKVEKAVHYFVHRVLLVLQAVRITMNDQVGWCVERVM